MMGNFICQLDLAKRFPNTVKTFWVCLSGYSWKRIMIWIRLSWAEQMVPVSVGGHHCLLRAVIVQKGGGVGILLFCPGTCTLLILEPSNGVWIFPPASYLFNLHIKYYISSQFPKSYAPIPVIHFVYVSLSLENFNPNKNNPSNSF